MFVVDMTRTELGEYLKGRRKISKADLARRSGLQRHQIDAIEKGGRNYTIDALLSYLRGIGYKLNAIMDLSVKK